MSTAWPNALFWAPAATAVASSAKVGFEGEQLDPPCPAATKVHSCRLCSVDLRPDTTASKGLDMCRRRRGGAAQQVHGKGGSRGGIWQGEWKWDVGKDKERKEFASLCANLGGSMLGLKLYARFICNNFVHNYSWLFCWCKQSTPGFLISLWLPRKACGGDFWSVTQRLWQIVCRLWGWLCLEPFSSKPSADAAVELRRALVDLGPSFVKLGKTGIPSLTWTRYGKAGDVLNILSCPFCFKTFLLTTATLLTGFKPPNHRMWWMIFGWKH